MVHTFLLITTSCVPELKFNFFSLFQFPTLNHLFAHGNSQNIKAPFLFIDDKVLIHDTALLTLGKSHAMSLIMTEQPKVEQSNSPSPV